MGEWVSEPWTRAQGSVRLGWGGWGTEAKEGPGTPGSSHSEGVLAGAGNSVSPARRRPPGRAATRPGSLQLCLCSLSTQASSGSQGRQPPCPDRGGQGRGGRVLG